MTQALPQIQGRLSYGDGLRIGLPVQPRRGQAVRDTASGLTYVWIDEPRLGDLGFWGAFISAIAGPIMGMFAGGGPKPDNAARQMLQQQQGQIGALQQQIDTQSFFDKKTIFIVALLGLAAVFAFKK